MHKHTSANWQFKKYFGDEAYIASLHAAGLQPTRLLSNDGTCSVVSDDGKHIATVTCQTKFKRGEGSTAECEERDANAALIAASPLMLKVLLAWRKLAFTPNEGKHVAAWRELIELREQAIKQALGE